MPLLPQPVAYDLAAWELALLEHRRALLERLLEEFPEVLTRHRSKIDIRRIKLNAGIPM